MAGAQTAVHRFIGTGLSVGRLPWRPVEPQLVRYYSRDSPLSLSFAGGNIIVIAYPWNVTFAPARAISHVLDTISPHWCTHYGYNFFSSMRSSGILLSSSIMHSNGCSSREKRASISVAHKTSHWLATDCISAYICNIKHAFSCLFQENFTIFPVWQLLATDLVRGKAKRSNSFSTKTKFT